MTKTEFLTTLAPYAVQLRVEGSPVFPSVRLAQNLLETGGIIHPWFNLGGIKVGSGKPNEWWDGSCVRKGTWEVINGTRIDTSANFRAYKSVYHFYKDQDLLFQNARYARVRAAKTPEEQANMLFACGYATDPQYAAKIINIIYTYNLKKYDKEAVKVLEELKRQIEGLSKEVQELKNRIEAPSWFVNEFGSGDLGGLINDPKFTLEGWRTLAVALRAIHKQN
jgi:flagellar protein FlgJ